MWWMAAASAAQGLMNYGADKASAKAAQAMQAYRNTMTRLADGVNQNAITTNEILSQQAFADQGIQLQRGAILTLARTQVTAAAAGVKGRSVNQAVFDVDRNAAMAERNRQISLNNANLAFDQQRLNSSLSSVMQQDNSFIPTPKLGSYLLKAAFQGGQAAFGGGGASAGSNTSLGN